MKRRAFVSIVILLLVAVWGGGENHPKRAPQMGVHPIACVEKVDATPDLMQTDPALDLLEGGIMSCGSVSATNAFAWLANHGYEELLVKDAAGNASYAATAQAMDRVLQLAARRGALPPAFLRGVARYLGERGYAEPDVLIVHDPAPRSGEGVSHDHVRIERIDSGRIAVDPKAGYARAYPQLPVEAAGYYKLAGELAYNPNADVAILDGVIFLEMKRDG